MGFKVNLAGVEVKSFAPIPPGRYIGKVDDLIITEKSKRSKQPKGQFVLTLIEGISPETEGYDPASKRKAFYEFSFQDQSLWNVKRSLIALGDDPADLEGELDLEKADYVGRECVVVSYNEEYEGIERSKVKRLEPLPDNKAAIEYLAKAGKTEPAKATTGRSKR